MTCPYLVGSRKCRAVADAPIPLPRDLVAASCRAAPEGCPAFRYLRATGHPAHPADFRAWVLRGVHPGRTEAGPDSPSALDGG
jgi:hypothetical protein